MFPICFATTPEGSAWSAHAALGHCRQKVVATINHKGLFNKSDHNYSYLSNKQMVKLYARGPIVNLGGKKIIR